MTRDDQNKIKNYITRLLAQKRPLTESSDANASVTSFVHNLQTLINDSFPENKEKSEDWFNRTVTERTT